jgi:hypothetical protein
MKRRLLLVATLGLVRGTGLVLGKAGWFGSRNLPAPVPTYQAQGGQSLSTAAAIQYRQGYPRHWRYLLLQH